ncbi:hypothetical protein BO78DRAFT_423103 [Aspergillus sclerotiicarbonarius CBS 121057]|uniref:Cytochrome P450 n=1 Tax=Aspergillus sclerotiicarbonarius (strain CBS 121057 / IBT 28362) TaxID=1448318 RepID=A0A319DVS1_ASPSB|nr:hypothetical protein BO78DRAFT_423103 [Aspergillus sclerotiicarbonarius CBS 121057]
METSKEFSVDFQAIFTLNSPQAIAIFSLGAPVVGYRSILEPTWLVRRRVIRGNRWILAEGYERFKDTVFKVRRVGTDILIVSSKYMDEIRTLTCDARLCVTTDRNAGLPTSFNAFRYTRLREYPDNAHRHLFVMTDYNNLAFGYGKFACPGRFYAANEMKMILAHLLICYDMKFLDGCGRPRNYTVDSDMYPDMAT